MAVHKLVPQYFRVLIASHLKALEVHNMRCFQTVPNTEGGQHRKR